MCEHFQLRSVKATRPVTLLAGLLGGAKICYRSRDRPRILVEYRRINLVGAGEFRSDIPARALSHVTIHARHPGVWRLQVSRVLRPHDGVTDLSAELHRIGELIG